MAPAASGRGFDLTLTAMKSLEPYREHLTIVSNTDARMADAFARCPKSVGTTSVRAPCF